VVSMLMISYVKGMLGVNGSSRKNAVLVCCGGGDGKEWAGKGKPDEGLC
jgi:hypothetical protein